MINGVTLLGDFKPDSRRIAELMWGDDPTEYKTNRRGARYFSCSRHGGYVVDARCLTTEEKDRIQPYTTQHNPAPINVLVQQQADRQVIIGTSYAHFTNSGRTRSIKYNPALGPVEWALVPVYTFEEDCAWSILEKMTSIRAQGMLMPSPNGSAPATPEYRLMRAEEVFNTYYNRRNR